MRTPVLLRTRVARRILGIFLVCAMVPVATVVLLTYQHVAGQLKLDAGARLRAESKTAGMLVIVRIESLANELERAAEGTQTIGWPPSGVSVSPLGIQQVPAGFQDVAVEQADGRLVSLQGRLDRVPSLSEAQVRHLEAGLPVLVTHSQQEAPRVHLVVRHPGARGGYPRVWGVASLVQIVGGDSVESPAPPGTELCLLDSHGAALDCPSAKAATALEKRDPGASSGIAWRDDDGRFLMGHWDVFLNRAFAASQWTIGLSIPESAALAPLAAFRRTFFLGLVLTGLLVFTLSHIQLRKRMRPLAELESGTRRIGEGDFSTPVMVQSNDEFKVLADSFNRMSGDLRQQFATLTALQAIDRAALEHQSVHAIAEAALPGMVELLEAEEVSVAAALEGNPTRWSAATLVRGAPAPLNREVRPSPAELHELATHPDHFVLAAGEPQRSYTGSTTAQSMAERLVFPILDRGRPRGTLVVLPRYSEGFEGRRAQLGRQLADQLAVALSNVVLMAELHALSLGAHTALARTIDAVSPWTAGHSERVSQRATEIGRCLGLHADQLSLLRRGGLLHDIGKIAIPPAILDKPGRLTDAEMLIIQSHPSLGAKILAPIAAFEELIPMVQSHHELLDGSGYPDRLRGEQIPRLVRILTAADVFDALVSDRPYRAGLSPHAAMEILRQGEGYRFDRSAVQALEQLVHQRWEPTEVVTLGTNASIPRDPVLEEAVLAVAELEVFT